MFQSETMVTERLVLRPPRAADASDIFERYGQDQEVTRYLVWRPHRGIEDAVNFLRDCEERRMSGKELTWAITLKDSDRLIGMIAYRQEQHKADLGYVLARPYWNKGYMTEAVKMVMTRALALPEIYRVWAVCDIANVASARVWRKRE